ncbi:MAG: glyoxalase/bleomycin resistance/dioxygenase family protein, partial [Candidatus Binatia bacterium]
GTTCCYAKADKFWVKDADGIAWEMYTLLEDAEAETAADSSLRTFLGQQTSDTTAEASAASPCCVPPQVG